MKYVTMVSISSMRSMNNSFTRCTIGGPCIQICGVMAGTGSRLETSVRLEQYCVVVL